MKEKKSTTNLPILDIINKTVTKIWMHKYNKPADSKTYVPFTSSVKLPQKGSILFGWVHLCYCWRRNHKTKTVIWAKNIKTTKYPIALIENSIKRALQISLNKLRKPKKKRTEEIISFLSAHILNIPNIFLIIR